MPNSLDSYRRAQRELRRVFDAFTRDNCAACPTPCCRQPARILPTDIKLAEASGWRAAVTREAAARQMEDPAVGEPCAFLGAGGCTFPGDLRPFGCTAYVCRFMYERLDKKELARVRRLVRELEEHHTALLRTLRPVEGWEEE